MVIFMLRMLGSFFFELCDLVLDAQKEVNVVIPVEQAFLFIRIDFEAFRFTGGDKGDALLLQVHGELGIRLRFNGFEEGSQEFFAETCTGSRPLLRALFLKISAKKLETTTLNP
jgi:hypothetical protein